MLGFVMRARARLLRTPDPRYARLNLRWNPFAEVTPRERVLLAVADVPALRRGDVVQFVGASGRGKTTLLFAVAERHGGGTYERLTGTEGRLRKPPPRRGVFLLDEAQRARPETLREAANRAPILALATDRDLSSAFDRPILTVNVGAPDLGRLRTIVDRRFAWARRGRRTTPTVGDETLHALLTAHRGDVRAILAALFDAVERLQQPGEL